MRRSCVIQLARFGDLLQTKRLLLSLRKKSCEVHLVCDSSLRQLAELVYPWVQLHTLHFHSRADSSLSVVTGFFAELRACDFDLVYNLNFSPLNFACASLFEPARVRGYRWQSGQPLKTVWTEQVFRLVRHRGPHSINLMDVWAGHCQNPVAPASVNPQARPGGKGIGLVLAGQNARRSLPAALQVRIAEAALARVGHGPVYLLGTRNQRRLVRDFLGQCRAPLAGECVDLVGKTDLLGLHECLSGLDLLLTPDTGAMHLAAHLGVPVLAFFLSSALCQETGPYGLGHQVVQAVPSCAPCLEARPCTREMACLRALMHPFVTQYVAGRDERLPREVKCFGSGFDEFGSRYDEIGFEPRGMEPDRAEMYFGQSGDSRFLPPAPYPWPERNWLLPRHEQDRSRFLPEKGNEQ